MIKAGTRAYASSTILKICYRFFSIYLVTNTAIRVELRAKIGCLDISEGSKSSSRSSSGKIDLEKVESGRPNVELRP